MSRQDITLHQGNDETVELTVTVVDSDDDLSTVTEVEVLLKPDRCTDDDDESVVTLSSDNASEVEIVSQTTDKIEAVAHIPGSALADPYPRWWRMDLLAGDERRTALYGVATVVDV